MPGRQSGLDGDNPPASLSAAQRQSQHRGNGTVRHANLRDRVISLVRRLRSRGVRASPGDAVTALESLSCVDVGDPAEVRLALLLSLAHRMEDLPIVDRCLDEFFWGEGVQGHPGAHPAAVGWFDPDEAAADPELGEEGGDPGGDEAGGPGIGDPGPDGASERDHLGGDSADNPAGGASPEPSPDRKRHERDAVLVAALGLGPESRRAGEDPEGTGGSGQGDPAGDNGFGASTARGGGSPGGYSPIAVLTRRDFQQLEEAERRQVERMAAQLGRLWATRPSRRFARSRSGRIDGRRALREAARRAGDLTRWPRRRPRIRKPRLVCLLDVSGSMDVYSQVFLHFLHALQHAGGRVETFAFGTRLTRLTPALRSPRAEVALARAAAVTADWSGGTRMGECLRVFLGRYGALLDRDTVLLVVSDGLDRGDLDLLDRCLRACRRRVRSLIWLNPLAGDPRYEPRAQGMRVALPYVDVLAPAHNIESLAQLVVVLQRQSKGRGIRRSALK